MALYYPPTTNGLQKTLGAALDQGVTASLTLNNVTGIQNQPGVIVINRIDTNGAEKDAADREYIAFTGTSGSTLTGLTRGLGGSTDQDHAVGSVVEFIWDVVAYQAVIDAIIEEHNADGTHKEAALDSIIAGSEAEGDIIYHNGTIWTRLAKGTDGQVLKLASGVPSWGSGAMSDESGYVKPGTDGEEIRAYDDAGTDYTEIGHDGTDSKINTNVGHIVLTPATDKLVKIAVYRDDNGTAGYENNSIILTGWGFQNGNGASNPFMQETVTFGITFDAAPIVLISSVGRSSAGAAGLNASWADYIAHAASNINTTSFRANTFRTPGATNLSNFDYVYSWIAVGELS